MENQEKKEKMDMLDQVMMEAVKRIVLKQKEENKMLLAAVETEVPEVAQNGRDAVELNNKLIDLFIEFLGERSRVVYIDYSQRLISLAITMMKNHEVFEDVKFLLRTPLTLHSVVKEARNNAMLNTAKVNLNTNSEVSNGKGEEILKELEKAEL